MMENNYIIKYLPIAVADIKSILDYISMDNPPAAIQLINNFDTSIASLSQFPSKGTIPNDIRLKSLNYRMLIIDSYIVFYVINESTSIIEIRIILNGKQN